MSTSGTAIPQDAFAATGGGVTGAVLPFKAEPEDGAILVHFKVLSESAEVRLQVAHEIVQALQGQRVANRGIAAIITGDEVEVKATDLNILATLILPQVLKRLGIRGAV